MCVYIGGNCLGERLPRREWDLVGVCLGVSVFIWHWSWFWLDQVGGFLGFSLLDVSVLR